MRVTGRVKFFKDREGYGFIKPDETAPEEVSVSPRYFTSIYRNESSTVSIISSETIRWTDHRIARNLSAIHNQL